MIIETERLELMSLTPRQLKQDSPVSEANCRIYLMIE